MIKPGYIKLCETGEIHKRVHRLNEILNNCRLCPRECGINRLSGETGICRSGSNPVVSSYNLHHGEEPPISARNGSGTVFFTNCSLACVFCQNYPISQLGNGNSVSLEGLAGMMLELQAGGAHNINFVTPTHFVPQIVEALSIAAGKGLNIPLVYNSGGYDSLEVLNLLEGIIDIYMPDIKYSNNASSEKYSGVSDYTPANRRALKEMHRQVGELIVKDGIAVKGLIIRHMVLPGGISGSEKSLEFISSEISKNTFMSIMAQYHPAHKACGIKELSRKISEDEYSAVIKKAEELGMENGWYQGLD